LLGQLQDCAEGAEGEKEHGAEANREAEHEILKRQVQVLFGHKLLHKAHRLTPAMAAGLTDKVMDVADIVRLIDAREASPKR